MVANVFVQHQNQITISVGPFTLRMVIVRVNVNHYLNVGLTILGVNVFKK